MMITYRLSFVLSAPHATEREIKASIAEFTSDLVVMPDASATGPERQYTLQMNVEDPTLIFDTCGQFGKIKSVKVDEVKIC
ncbi:MAG: hypothetical protein KBA46_01630 [Candidatus Omnitrophica bacterium]|nr:hypothetical protein [Candidatus Omnitrophota bacterium]